VTLFIDASAMVALLAREPTVVDLAPRLGADQDRLCSAMSLWEAVAALCRSYAMQVPAAREAVDDFVRDLSLRLVPIGERETQIAIDAYADYGKGRHPAALNMGDCFAYACAKANRATLLYTGQDFAKTDLA
jgi:ribonuclease VapC